MEARLRRRENARIQENKITSPKVWIFTEGDVTEPEYFNEWKRAFLDRTDYARLEIKKSDTESDPKSVFSRAEDCFNSSTNMDKKDYIFIVIDEDDRFDNKIQKNSLEAIFEKCSLGSNFCPNKINCIFSNRSFEFWGLLHFLEQPSTAPLTKKELKKKLQSFLKKYNEKNKRFDFSLMKSNISRAKRHAQAIRCFHDNNRDASYITRPTTNVDELIDFLEKYFLIKHF